MSRIADCLSRLRQQGRKGLVAFITAGDPDLPATLTYMQALTAAGADIIELGVPFSDPMADGPVIQRASERALANGVSLKQVIDLVAAFRAGGGITPVVLMGYANPIEAMGAAAFATAAAAAGVDGVLTVDYPPEECEACTAELVARGIDPIFLLAPTSTEARIEQVSRAGRGFIYYVSLRGVTGAGHLDFDEIAGQLARIRARTGLPVAAGFGIRDAQSAATMARLADAVVVGSRIIQEIEAGPAATAADRVEQLARALRAGIDDA